MHERDVATLKADLQQLFSMTLELLRDPATANAFAAFADNYRAALESRGFSRAEALRIVAAHRLPAVTSSVAS